MSLDALIVFLFGVSFGIGAVLLAFLWQGVRAVQAQRQALAAQVRRERQP